MSNQYLKLRRSAVPGKIPDTASLDFGEIALNTYDGLAFMKKSGSSGEEIVTIGSGGSNIDTGSFATTGSNTFKGTQTITGSYGRLIYTGNSSTTLAQIHANNDNPWLEKFYNDSFSSSSAAMAYFAWNDGRFVFHNESTQSIGLQVNGWNAENGLLVYPNKVAFVNNIEATGSITAPSITSSLFGTASWAQNSLTASYAKNGGVTQLFAGPNITLSPTNGLGQVTITANLSGSTSYNTATGSYGSFYDTTTQTNPIANIPRSMSFNTTDITNGVSLSGSTNPFNTYIKIENPGVYNIQFSAQLDKTDSGKDEIVIWLRKNGIDLTDSATTLTLNGNDDKVVAAWNWFTTSNANDYYQIIWYSADTNLRLLAETAGGGHPGIPSVILTANRIDAFLSNTGSFSGSFTGNFIGPLQGTSSWASNAVTASYVTGSIFTNSNIAASASYAGTASSADNFLVRGTLIAQTIVAQTITSSTDYVTGSTIFGSLLSNTHQFTGSVSVTGSFFINGNEFYPNRISIGIITASVNTTPSNLFLINSGSVEYFNISSSGNTTVNSNLFIIKNIRTQQPVLTVSESIVQFVTQSSAPTGIAGNGSIWFTSTNLYIGLD